MKNLFIKWSALVTVILVTFSACSSSNEKPSDSSSSSSSSSPSSSASSSPEAEGIRYWVTGLTESLTYDQVKSFVDSDYPLDSSIAGMTFAFSDEVQPVYYKPDGQTTYPDSITGTELPIPHFSIMAFNHLEDSAVFGNQQAELVSGSMLEPTDQNQCLISKELADETGKSIGDTIRFQNSLDSSLTGEYQIKGLFQMVGYESTDTPYPSNDPNNTIYVSVTDLSVFNGNTAGNSQWIISNVLLPTQEDLEPFLQELQGKGLPSSVQLMTEDEIYAAQQEVQNRGTPIESLTELTGISLTDGSAITADIFQQNDVTMVNIWATYCSPCIAEMEDLGELSREYQEAGESLGIIGVLSDVITKEDETAELALEIAEKTKADYPHVILDFDAYQTIMPQIYAVPTTLFVNRDGTVLSGISGARSKAQWQKLIDPLLSNGNS